MPQLKRLDLPYATCITSPRKYEQIALRMPILYWDCIFACRAYGLPTCYRYFVEGMWRWLWRPIRFRSSTEDGRKTGTDLTGKRGQTSRKADGNRGTVKSLMKRHERGVVTPGRRGEGCRITSTIRIQEGKARLFDRNLARNLRSWTVRRRRGQTCAEL